MNKDNKLLIRGHHKDDDLVKAVDSIKIDCMNGMINIPINIFEIAKTINLSVECIGKGNKTISINVDNK